MNLKSLLPFLAAGLLTGCTVESKLSSGADGLKPYSLAVHVKKGDQFKFTTTLAGETQRSDVVIQEIQTVVEADSNRFVLESEIQPNGEGKSTGLVEFLRKQGIAKIVLNSHGPAPVDASDASPKKPQPEYTLPEGEVKVGDEWKGPLLGKSAPKYRLVDFDDFMGKPAAKIELLPEPGEKTVYTLWIELATGIPLEMRLEEPPKGGSKEGTLLVHVVRT